MTEDSKSKNKKILSRPVLGLITGLLFITIGVSVILRFWPYFLVIFKGCIGLALVLSGAVIILLAKK